MEGKSFTKSTIWACVVLTQYQSVTEHKCLCYAVAKPSVCIASYADALQKPEWFIIERTKWLRAVITFTRLADTTTTTTTTNTATAAAANAAATTNYYRYTSW